MIKEENLKIECPHCGVEFTYRHRYGVDLEDGLTEESKSGDTEETSEDSDQD